MAVAVSARIVKSAIASRNRHSSREGDESVDSRDNGPKEETPSCAGTGTHVLAALIKGISSFTGGGPINSHSIGNGE